MPLESLDSYRSIALSYSRWPVERTQSSPPSTALENRKACELSVKMQGKKTGKVQGPDPKVGVYVGEGGRWVELFETRCILVGFAADIDDLVYVR